MPAIKAARTEDRSKPVLGALLPVAAVPAVELVVAGQLALGLLEE